MNILIPDCIEKNLLMKGYIKLRKRAWDILESELSDRLLYHDISHTKDVLRVCNQYIRRQGISGYNAKLLRLAALLHDIGFTVAYADHEEKSVEIATQLMRECGFHKADISVVSGLIMATKIPQQPKTKLEKIICDSDLDYLGRKDFYPISRRLYKEFLAFSIVSNEQEWNQVQLKFLETHTYHTSFARENRQPVKEQHLKVIKSMVSLPT